MLNWERPERAAAFVDPDDPAVTAFVRAVWTYRRPTGRAEFPTANLVGALALLTALAERDPTYLPDSTNPASDRADGRAIDRVNFPGETLLAGSGDCDDLSILACSILAAARIPSALAVGPSHVLFLLDSGIRTDRLSQTPFEPGTVVSWKGRIWVPVEATDFTRRTSNLASAWAAAWPRCAGLAAGEFKLIDIDEAWREYQPMPPPPDEGTRRRIAATPWVRDGFPERVEAALANLRKAFRGNLDRRVGEIESARGPGPERDLEVGALFFRAGLFDEARAAFERALFGPGGPPAGAGAAWTKPVSEDDAVLLENLAICLTQAPRSGDDLDRAAGYEEAALRGIPEAARLERGEGLLRLALVQRLRGDLAAERDCAAKAFLLEPALEETYRKLIDGQVPPAGPETKVLGWLADGIRDAFRRR